VTIRSTLTEQTAVVEMAGNVAATDLSTLHSCILDLLNARKKSIVLDFHGVEHVDYQDASHLAREFELVRNYNGSMRVSGLTPYVRNILVFAGLSDFLDSNTPGAAALEPARAMQAS
jgi:anti-anti-sigma factor